MLLCTNMATLIRLHRFHDTLMLKVFFLCCLYIHTTMIKQQLRVEIQVSLRWLLLRMVYEAF